MSLHNLPNQSSFRNETLTKCWLLLWNFIFIENSHNVTWCNVQLFENIEMMIWVIGIFKIINSKKANLCLSNPIQEIVNISILTGYSFTLQREWKYISGLQSPILREFFINRFDYIWIFLFCVVDFMCLNSFLSTVLF